MLRDAGKSKQVQTLTQEQISAIAHNTKIVVNRALEMEKLQVKKMFLIGSYARTAATPDSDVDLLIELQGGRLYPTWMELQWINGLLPPKVHVIFGTEEAQISLGYPYEPIKEALCPGTLPQDFVQSRNIGSQVESFKRWIQ